MSLDLLDDFKIESGLRKEIIVDPHDPALLRKSAHNVPDHLTVQVAELFAAIGLAVCQRSAPQELVEAQKNASFAALSACCSIKSGRLHVDKTILHLNETKRNSISHDLGAGLAMIVMNQMGYHWLGLAEDHIKPSVETGFKSGKCPDLVFDSGNGSTELIAAEAKGSTANNKPSGIKNLRNRLETACKSQIANVLGATTKHHAVIGRGFAIGCSALADGPAAEYHVAEALSHHTSAPIKGLSADASSDKPGNRPIGIVALRHYLGVFRLLGAHNLADKIAARLRQVGATGEEPFDGPSSPGRRMRVFEASSAQYLVSDLIEPPESAFLEKTSGFRFGLNSKIFNFVKNELLLAKDEDLFERFPVPDLDKKEDAPEIGLPIFGRRIRRDGLVVVRGEVPSFESDVTG